MTPTPIPRARWEIHQKVSELLPSLGPAAGKKALDAPLGPGAMAMHLHELGYAVTGVDVNLTQSAGLPPAVNRQLCNLNAPLPFPDATFDLVTSLEGIEHVENHFLMARELGRVTRPGGHLIISTPNISNLENRLKYFISGTDYRFITRAEVEQRGSGFAHQNLIRYVQLRQVLDWAGYEILRVERDTAKWKQNVFLFPFWLLLKAYVAIQSEKRRQKYLLSETAAKPVLLGGNTIILLARKMP